MHMHIAAIDALPPVGDPEYADRAAVVLSGLRKLQTSLSEAAGRSRVTPSVIVALSGVRHRYDELMTTAAEGPAATLGQRLYVARGRAKLSTQEAANGVGLAQGPHRGRRGRRARDRGRNRSDQGSDRRPRRLAAQRTSGRVAA